MIDRHFGKIVVDIELLHLARRCEESSGPSRLLDFEAHIIIAGDPIWPATDMRGFVTNPNSRMSDYLRAFRDVIDADDQDFDFPRYSSSIDAARSLYPWNEHPHATLTARTVQSGVGQLYHFVEFTWPSTEMQGRARTEALATFASALRAIQRTRQELAPYR